MSYRKPKISQQEIEPELTPRLLVIKKEYEDLGLEYVLSEVDKKEVAYSRYKERYPDSFVYSLHRMVRVQHKVENILYGELTINLETNTSNYIKIHFASGATQYIISR